MAQNETSLSPAKPGCSRRLNRIIKIKNTLSPELSQNERANSSVSGTSLLYLPRLSPKAPQPTPSEAQGPGFLQSRDRHWGSAGCKQHLDPPTGQEHPRAKSRALGATANTIQNWNNHPGPDSHQNSIIKGLHTTKTFQRSILSQTSFHSYQIPGPEL